MHSNLLEIALERGLPALTVWLILLGLYARLLWQGISAPGSHSALDQEPNNHLKIRNSNFEFRKFLQNSHWMDRGIMLGALGGLAGFLASGVVHYNWGDSEVVMIFYFLMGLTVFLHRAAHTNKKP